MLKFSSIMVGTARPKTLGNFYTKVLGKPDWAEGDWYGWESGGVYFHLGKHSEVKGKAKEPQRVLLNFESKKVKEEFERIKGLGAVVIKEPYDMEGSLIATFADPDGNYFQIMSPWK